MVHWSEREDFYGELSGLDWTETPDWADREVATVWRTSMNWSGNPKGPEDVAALIRKARKRALADAAKIASDWTVKILQFPKEDLQDHVESMMNEIGPNISKAILSAVKNTS